MSYSSASTGLIQRSLYASGTEHSNIPYDNNNHNDTSAAVGDDEENQAAPPNNDYCSSCQLNVEALLNEIQELKQAAEEQMTSSQNLTQQLLILQEKVQSSSCFNNSRVSGAVGATHNQNHPNVIEEEKTEEAEREGDENSRNNTVPPPPSTNDNKEETTVSALFCKVLKRRVYPLHYEYYASGAPSLLYMSHTSYLAFVICYLPTSINIEYDLFYRNSKATPALGIGSSAFLLISAVTSFANIYKKGIVSLVGWLLYLAGAIIFAVAMKEFLEYEFFSEYMLVAFGLFIPRHAIELVQVCSTAIQQKWGMKPTLVISSSPVLGIIAFTLAFFVENEQDSDFFGLHIIFLVFHALAQYTRIFYALPKASDSNNNNVKEIEHNDEPEPFPDDMLDSYAFMMTSDDPKTWNFGFALFFIQAGLASMILMDQVILTESLIPLDAPHKFTILVTFAQFFGLLLTTFWQTDILTSIRMLSMMWYRPNGEWPWNNIDAKNDKFGTWVDKVFLPNMLRLIQGLLVLVTSFVIIVKSEDVIDLFKDFTALILISEIDNIAFRLASQWYFGKKLKNEADKIKEISLTDNTMATICWLPIRLFVLLLIFISMLGGWAYFVQGQASGRFYLLSEGLPNCTVSIGWNIGDGVCHSGSYNTEDCRYDGGDCIEFNAKYPNCTVDDPYPIGDGNCDSASYNIEDCGYEGGDCIEFNTKYPNCNVDYPSYIGNGYCYDSEPYNTAECGYDGGDC